MKRITYDATPGDPATEPRAGDLLESTKSRYAIVSARQVRSRVHPSRWALEVVPCVSTTEASKALGFRVLPLRWYPRGRRLA